VVLLIQRGIVSQFPTLRPADFSFAPKSSASALQAIRAPRRRHRRRRTHGEPYAAGLIRSPNANLIADTRLPLDRRAQHATLELNHPA
jgi:hypothetical protein